MLHLPRLFLWDPKKPSFLPCSEETPKLPYWIETFFTRKQGGPQMDSFLCSRNKISHDRKVYPLFKFLLGSTGFVLSLQVDGRRHLFSPLYLSGSTCSIPNPITHHSSAIHPQCHCLCHHLSANSCWTCYATAISCRFRPCLVPQKFCKIFQISRHIEFLNVCMEY